jgi:hypothetical protein
MSADHIPGSPVPNQFTVTLSTSADFEAHIAGLPTEIDAANASGAEPNNRHVVSQIALNAKEAMGLPIYGGFSARKWSGGSKTRRR